MRLLSYLTCIIQLQTRTNVCKTKLNARTGGAVQIKYILRFYFSAGSLNATLDNIITNLAVSSGRDIYAGGEEYFERISKIISIKRKLGDLWARLDAILSEMTEKDRATLKRYAALRVGVKGEEKREIHRAAVKFTRRAGSLLNGGKALSALNRYRCLLSPAPD